MGKRQQELVKEQYDRWKYQGRRKEQVESSYRIIGYGAVSVLIFTKFFTLLLIAKLEI